MLTLSILDSLKSNLIFKGIILTLILILSLIFVYVIQPYVHHNSNDFSPKFVIEITNIFSIMLLGLILILTGSLVITMVNIFRLRSSFDSNLDVKTYSSTQEETAQTTQNSDKKPDTQVQKETRFENSEAEKVKNERLFTMGSLAAGIIHDFKNPISNISLCVQAITKGYGDGEKRDFYLKKIEDQVDRMLNMTQDFLDYAQGQKSIKLQKIEFTETIKNQIEFHREKSEKKNVGLRYSLPDPFYIKIDVHKFRRVLDNILTNAFEVLKSGQSINIDISIGDSGLQMQISDDGPGISADILPNIFEPFFTHGKSKGSGLGLSISKKIVEDHGGGLTVKAEVGKGTCFTISLPSQLICKEPKPISAKSDVIAS